MKLNSCIKETCNAIPCKPFWPDGIVALVGLCFYFGWVDLRLLVWIGFETISRSAEMFSLKIDGMQISVANNMATAKLGIANIDYSTGRSDGMLLHLCSQLRS